MPFTYAEKINVSPAVTSDGPCMENDVGQFCESADFNINRAIKTGNIFFINFQFCLFTYKYKIE